MAFYGQVHSHWLSEKEDSPALVQLVEVLGCLHLPWDALGQVDHLDLQSSQQEVQILGWVEMLDLVHHNHAGDDHGNCRKIKLSVMEIQEKIDRRKDRNILKEESEGT